MEDASNALSGQSGKGRVSFRRFSAMSELVGWWGCLDALNDAVVGPDREGFGIAGTGGPESWHITCRFARLGKPTASDRAEDMVRLRRDRLRDR
jgi:hypothetical protein